MLEDCREDAAILFEVDERLAVFGMQDAGFEIQTPSATAVEVQHVAAHWLIVLIRALASRLLPDSGASAAVPGGILDWFARALDHLFVGVTFPDGFEYCRGYSAGSPPLPP